MNGVLLAVTVSAAGGGGAAGRLVVDAEIGRRWPRALGAGTFVVNTVGSFFAGLVVGLALTRHLDHTLRTVIVTGFCGGLTTWSTAMFEIVRLFATRRRTLAIVFGAGGFLTSLAAAALGLVIVGA